MTDHFSPKSEVRFAVVMYGGVSLAIYMNGIAQELLRMVRATATQSEDNLPLIDYRDLDSVEIVYRKLAYCHAGRLDADAERSLLESNAPLTRKFTIDIISGTSAGGINGIFLAKALANGQKIDELKNLWIREGDVNLLLNDKNSVKKTGLHLSKEPASLFNSQRMYQKLLTAFTTMEKPAEGDRGAGEAKKTPYVSEIDLFVTATDILGLTLPIKLADATVYERKHRTVFRFSASGSFNGQLSWNDFDASNNPMLAFAARCTSSFPFAFEPMRLCDIDEVLDTLKYGDDSYADNSRWKRFFKNYPDAAPGGTVHYMNRPFGDGGYLDNKPFTYALETIAGRSADYPIDRKLFYIEPVPGHPELEAEKDGKPNAIENSLDALLKLPRYETIREDLEKVFERNRLMERIDSMIKNLERDKTQTNWVPAYAENKIYQKWEASGSKGDEPLWAKPNLSDKEWGQLDLADMNLRRGPGYVAYHRLEIAVVTDDFGRLLTRVAGFDEDSDNFLVFRYLVRAWRELAYTEYRKSGDTRQTLNAFLHAFDLTFPMRRLKFLQRQIDRLYLSDQEAVSGEVSEWFERDIPNTGINGAMPPAAEWIGHFREALLGIKQLVNARLAILTQAGRALRSRFVPGAGSQLQPSPLYELVGQLAAQLSGSVEITGMQTGASQKEGAANQGTSRESERENPFLPVIDYFLNTSGELRSDGGSCREADERDGEEKARLFLKKYPELFEIFNRIGVIIENVMKQAIEASDNACRDALLPCNNTESAGFGEKAAQSMIWSYYRKYSDFDMIIFPVTYGTGAGEGGLIDVARISPEDAMLLINERDSRLRKLAGTSLGNFGAFMEKRWRQNDIMWGQLDGSERIITELMPDRNAARGFIGEAHAAIVLETIAQMGKEESYDLLAEPFMRPDNGRPDPESLSAFTGRLRKHAGDELRTKLDEAIDDRALRDHYLRKFSANKALEPESALRNAARATTITGKMLSGISEQYDLQGKKYVSLITNAGRFFLWLVEAATPRSFSNLIIRHWMHLLYLFEVVVFIGGYLFVNESVQRFALTAAALTLGIHASLSWLNSLIRFRKRLNYLFGTLGIALVILLLVSGFVFLYGLLGFQDTWWKHFIKLHDWVHNHF